MKENTNTIVTLCFSSMLVVGRKRGVKKTKEVVILVVSEVEVETAVVRTVIGNRDRRTVITEDANDEHTVDLTCSTSWFYVLCHTYYSP